jgi:hypothetical protein
MRAFSWLRGRIGGDGPRSTGLRRSKGRPAPQYRPQLDALEGRCVPSTLTVLNNRDSGAGSLRAAIAAAHVGDAITFAPNLAGQTITLTTGELLIKQNLTIVGLGAGQLTISGNNASRVFEVGKNATVALSGLTISNGYVVSAELKSGFDTTNGHGGGVLNHGVLTVSGCTLSHNTANRGGSGGSYDGGGINNDGTLTVSNSTLSYNAAGGGGGIYNEPGGILTVDNNCILSLNTGGGIGNDGTAMISASQVLNNTAIRGGGIANTATMTLSGCTISGNAAVTSPGGEDGEGGGIWASNGRTTNALTVSGCTVTGNSSTGEGGGIYVGNGAVNVADGSVLTGNSGTYGGGIYVYFATLTVGGSTLSNNSASTAGGGIYIEPRFASPVTVGGSVFGGNTSGPASTPDNIVGVWTDGGGNTFM